MSLYSDILISELDEPHYIRTCVKWDTTFSRFLKINIGLRQGSVLSLQLFAIYLNDVASCLTIRQRYHVVLYADDILCPDSSELSSLEERASHNQWLGSV